MNKQITSELKLRKVRINSYVRQSREERAYSNQNHLVVGKRAQQMNEQINNVL